MILQWKSNGPLESVSKWQGIGLTAKWLPAIRNWRLALTGAALVPDGAFTKGQWSTLRGAQEAADAALERIIERRAQSHQPPVATQRVAVSGRSGGAYIGSATEIGHLGSVKSNIKEGPSVRFSGVFSGFSRFREELTSDASDGTSYAS
jgi:hypothetical protein